ncbi:MAG: transcriptional activator NhaR [Gammaproteobacteria bacterium]|jgi:LysR family transcriptional activator of nhaA|nr:transcriptional activator NhaR [Gammaproteobacteria bacterium]NDF86534.1 transcriptional activator NhaR [Gammaproteobacteria bacterium]
MRHLNYTHLLYFWSIVREGGVAAAAAAMHVTPQTVSGQVKLLEEQLQGALFEKQGRRLVPTELGRIAYAYAEDIFPRGLELASVLRGARTRGSRQVTVGVADAVPKLITWRVLEPLLAGNGKFHVICHEAPLNALLADLAAHRLDLVLATSAVPTDSSFKAYSHLLGESEIGFFAAKPLAERLRRGFPQSLHDAPLLVPTDRSANRRVLDLWFEKQGITPRIVGELDDSALVKTFAQHGVGAFAIPLAIEKEVTRQYKVSRVGRIEGLKARFYAISTERRIKHPALAMITETARTDLFSQRPNGNTRAESAA